VALFARYVARIRLGLCGRYSCVLAPLSIRPLRVSEGEKLVLIQALLSQSTIEAFNQSIVCRLAWSAELELHAITMSPDVEDQI
jgi:hypothetical protein